MKRPAAQGEAAPARLSQDRGWKARGSQAQQAGPSSCPLSGMVAVTQETICSIPTPRENGTAQVHAPCQLRSQEQQIVRLAPVVIQPPLRFCPALASWGYKHFPCFLKHCQMDL